MDGVYCASDGVVARSIAGQLVIVPVRADAGRPDDELYVLNDTGEALWARLDGTRPLKAVILELAREYRADQEAVERDVTRLTAHLLERRIVVAAEG